MTFREAMNLGEQILMKAGIEDAKNDTWLLLAFVCHIDHTFYYTHMDDELLTEQTEEFRTVLAKRAERVPLQYITEEQEFMGINFRVNSHVLVPRQDTETLVEHALRYAMPGMKVLDMCTGSGCILISVMKNCGNITGVGCDISKQALIVAKENARRNNVDAQFERSNLFDHVTEKFDMILSNPPYIPSAVIPTLMPEVAVFEPIEALDGMEDGLYFYREIVRDSVNFLNPGGYLMFEIGFDQGQDVSEMMKQTGYKDVSVIKDLAGNDRVVSGHL